MINPVEYTRLLKMNIGIQLYTNVLMSTFFKGVPQLDECSHLCYFNDVGNPILFNMVTITQQRKYVIYTSLNLFQCTHCQNVV